MALEPVFTPEPILKQYIEDLDAISDAVKGAIAMYAPVVVIPDSGADGSHLVLIYGQTAVLPL